MHVLIGGAFLTSGLVALQATWGWDPRTLCNNSTLLVCSMITCSLLVLDGGEVELRLEFQPGMQVGGMACPVPKFAVFCLSCFLLYLSSDFWLGVHNRKNTKPTNNQVIKQISHHLEN